MTRSSLFFGCLASFLAACAQADGPGISLTGKDGGGTDVSTHPDVKPGTDTAVLPGDDTATPPDEDTASGTKDTKTGTDTSSCSVPAGKTCTLFPQCGCTGKNCDVTKADGTTSCVAAGTKALHDPCTASGQCGAGLTCIAGNCLPFCATGSDCTGGGDCVNIKSGGTPSTDIPGYLVCFEDCDPVSPATTCGKGSCQFDDSSHTVCTGAGSGTGAGGCSTTAPFGCAPGYVCLTTNACAKWCRVGFPSDCPGGTCGPLTSAPTKGGVEYGVCM